MKRKITTSTDPVSGQPAPDAPMSSAKKKISKVMALSIIVVVIRNVFISLNYSSLSEAQPGSKSPLDPAKEVHEASLEAYTSCLEEALMNLPIGKGRVWAHHWDARNPQWNQDIRFAEMPELASSQNTSCSVWEVGAHKRADDTRTLLGKYPKCEYHAYEPIPVFFATLSKHWKSTLNVHTHNYGLAKEDGGFKVTDSIIKGQSTYIGDSKESEGGEGVTAVIKSFDYAVREAGAKPTLLHMNCEGCEWTLLPGAVESGFIQDIPVIQIGFHNYGNVGLGKRVIEYCEIRQQLNHTHDLVDGAVPFGWERWVLKIN